jgi:hypothetical protein
MAMKKKRKTKRGGRQLPQFKGIFLQCKQRRCGANVPISGNLNGTRNPEEEEAEQEQEERLDYRL